MKLSKYNVVMNIDGELMLMNTLSLNLLSIDDNTANIIASGKLIECSQEQLSMLRDGEFVINDDVDEICYIEEHFDLEKRDPVLSIKFLLSTTCNSDCVYCYQHYASYKSMTVSDEQVNAFFKWVDAYVKSNNIERFVLELFGGEPLLAASQLNLIFTLLDKLKSKHNFKEFSISIITNTSLFTPKTLSLLVKHNVEFKFSIDGSKIIHDNRRRLKNGDSSYDKTISAIQYIKEMGRIDLVTIRFNLDKDNLDSLKDVAQKMHELGVQRLYCGKVFFRGKETPYSSKIIDDESYYKGGTCKQLFNILSSYGYSDTPCSIDLFKVCQFHRLHSYVVSPSLEVAKCDELLDIKEQQVGAINFDGRMLLNKNYSLQTGQSPMRDSECRECAYLPICGMGCPIQAMNLTGSPLNHSCMNKKILTEKIKILLSINNE